MPAWAVSPLSLIFAPHRDPVNVALDVPHMPGDAFRKLGGPLQRTADVLPSMVRSVDRAVCGIRKAWPHGKVAVVCLGKDLFDSFSLQSCLSRLTGKCPNKMVDRRWADREEVGADEWVLKLRD